MGRKPRTREGTLRGSQLLASGDIIQVLDQGQLTKCRVLSCLAREEGSCMAALEILEGERKGQRIQTLLRPADQVEDA